MIGEIFTIKISYKSFVYSEKETGHLEMSQMSGYDGRYSYRYRSQQFGPVDVTVTQRGGRPFPIDVITELS